MRGAALGDGKNREVLLGPVRSKPKALLLLSLSLSFSLPHLSSNTECGSKINGIQIPTDDHNL